MGFRILPKIPPILPENRKTAPRTALRNCHRRRHGEAPTYPLHALRRPLRPCGRENQTARMLLLPLHWLALGSYSNNVGVFDRSRLQLSPFFLAGLEVQFCQRLIRQETNPVTRDAAADSRLEIHHPVTFAVR